MRLSAQLHLPVKVYPAWSDVTATLKGNHWVYYMGMKNSIITALQRKYMFSLTTVHWWP